VHQVVATLRASEGDVDEAAAYLGLSARQVRAALDYYADFQDEVDADAQAAQRIEAAERDRWERQQRALA
ncbi:MAG: helix-turn-helix domain-containing protein, partial [Acidimicrobiia bacterium]